MTSPDVGVFLPSMSPPGQQPGDMRDSARHAEELGLESVFYQAVFGWETTSVDFGAGESWLWRRPGYSDFLEQLDPGVKQRHRDVGAPEGFTDAIGWLQPITDTASPHLDITFSVDDTDATVDRARSLGGTILMPPFDIPYSRMAVLADPQGARFTVSRFTPPD